MGDAVDHHLRLGRRFAISGIEVDQLGKVGCCGADVGEDRAHRQRRRLDCRVAAEDFGDLPMPTTVPFR